MEILSLVEKHTALAKQGSNYVGPCPKCGGSPATTRFVVNPAKNFCQCYSCGFNADPIRFLRVIEGMSCPAAHRAAGEECNRPECPLWDKCSRGAGDRPDMPKHETVARPSRPYIAPVTAPADLWQEKASALIDYAHQHLLSSPEQLEYLAGRGLPLEAAIKYRLGYIPATLWRERAAWGLPVETKPDGKTKKLFIPQGLVIPWYIGDSVHRIRIRKQTLFSEKDSRYYWMPGSGNDIICLNPESLAHVIIESDLDGLLIDWAVGDVVATIPLGSCQTKPKEAAYLSLEKSLKILVALDFDRPRWDEQKQRDTAPGADAAQWWQKTFPEAYKRWPVPAGKDPGEAYQAGVDIRAWILAGLPPALRITPPPASTVRPAPAPPAGDPPPLNQSMTDRKGRPYTITDSRSIYRQKQAAGEVVFSEKEMALSIEAVNGAGELGGKLADLIMEVKNVFQGSYLQKVEEA